MSADPDARFTVGRISVEPGSVDAIPGKASCTVDIRHPDPSELDALEQLVASAITEEADRQRCSVEISRSFDMAPCTFSTDLQKTIERAATSRGFKSSAMLSGAFHDALFVNRIAPAAMIFVPCRDGLSHNEAEFVEPEHAFAGYSVLAEATLCLVDRTSV